jgi:hypothetical protein
MFQSSGLTSGVSKIQQDKISYNINVTYLYNAYFNNCKKKRTDTYLTKQKDYEQLCIELKAAMKKIILDPNVDTIGLNNNPRTWNIPDGSYQQLLIDLNIDKTLPIIKETIQKRMHAKPMSYQFKKATGTLGGRKTRRKRRGTRKTKRRKSKR